MPQALTTAGLRRAVGTLTARDTALACIATRVGVPPLWGRRPGFATLVRIILEQQVSLASAWSFYDRLRRHLGVVSAATVHAMGESGLRDFGMTRQKARYCHGLAALILSRQLDLTAVAASPDETGRSILLAVPGLGPWSVDIYYLMALRRPDIWPEGDLALATALRDVKRLRALPTRDEQRIMAAAWAPLRSVAARLLWAHYLEARGQYAPPERSASPVWSKRAR